MTNRFRGVSSLLVAATVALVMIARPVIAGEGAVGPWLLRDPLASFLAESEPAVPVFSLLAELVRGSERVALYWPCTLKPDGSLDDDVFAVVFSQEAGAWRPATVAFKVSGKDRESFLARFPLQNATRIQRPAPPAAGFEAYIQTRLDAARGQQEPELARIAEELAAAFTLETGVLSDRMIEALLEARVADSLVWKIRIAEDGTDGEFRIARRHGGFTGHESGALEFEADGAGLRISSGRVAVLNKDAEKEAAKGGSTEPQPGE